MKSRKLKVLLIVEACNQEWSSVPLVGYKYYQAISQLADVTLVTHGRNKAALDKILAPHQVIYIQESKLIQKYHKLIHSFTYSSGRKNWPLYNALGYLVYAEFNSQVYEKFKSPILKGEYDIVHALTPMMPRYPVKAVQACQNTPFLLGPVNGGVPFPKGFQEIAKQEFAQFNFLRAIGRALIPGYVDTYKKADKVLAGSTYTLDHVKDLFSLKDDKINLFYENGISQDFLDSVESKKLDDKVNLLFVGRLVPYKGADMLIEAISKLPQEIKNKIRFTIVGDGSEKSHLEAIVKQFNLEDLVAFTGWIQQQETLEYYQKSDIFCFPSVREFGGAVVLEAMACGLPCIVVNNGGIGEYVTEETGFKIDPDSREYVTKELVNKIIILVTDEQLRKEMSANSVERVKEFEWGYKAKKIVDFYHQMIDSKNFSYENIAEEDNALISIN